MCEKCQAVVRYIEKKKKGKNKKGKKIKKKRCGADVYTTCEICEKKFCINCMMSVCKVCHIEYACFFCNKKNRNISTCKNHSQYNNTDEYIVKCQNKDCGCENELISVNKMNDLFSELETKKNIINIYDLSERNQNTIDEIFYGGTIEPWIFDEWDQKLHNIPVWKNICKDVFMKRDIGIIKAILDKMKYTFISFDGDYVEFICTCSIRRKMNGGDFCAIGNDDPTKYEYMCCGNRNHNDETKL